MELTLTVCVILGSVSSLMGLVATCVRQWAYRDFAGQTEILGLWYSCLENECTLVQNVAVWLYAVRGLMITGVILISAGTVSLIIYKNLWRNSKLGISAASFYLAAACMFFIAVLTYGINKYAEDDFKYMNFYNAFYIAMALTVMCAIGAMLISFTWCQERRRTKDEESGDLKKNSIK